MHTSFNQAVAATGRLSSSDPNLQNIPIRSDLGREIRRAFVAEPGNVLISADYSQIELRVLAHLSSDETLIAAFQRGDDIHDQTALKVFGADSGLSPHELRRRAKIVNYALLYGKTAFTLAKDIGVTQQAAQEFIDAYFAGFPRVRAFIDRTLDQARATGVVKTMFGRRRLVPEIISRNGQVRASAERMTVNMPIQGTAADILKLAMIALDDELGRRNAGSRNAGRPDDSHGARRAGARSARGGRGRDLGAGAREDERRRQPRRAPRRRHRSRGELEGREELTIARLTIARLRMRARLLVLAAAVLFSTGGAAIKATSLTAWQVASFRSGIAALAVLVMLRGARRVPDRATWLVGIVYAATLVFFVFANKNTTAANAIYLQGTAPLYILLAAPVLLRERVSGADLVFMAALGWVWGRSSWVRSRRARRRRIPRWATWRRSRAASRGRRR